MKNANISRLGGFTLIELLVVVLIYRHFSRYGTAAIF